MASRLAVVKELIPGSILSDTVLSLSGKVLLSKDVVLTHRHISLLISWDVQNVFIEANEEQPVEQLSQESEAAQEALDEEYQQIVQALHSFTNDIEHTFDIIKRRNKIPIIHLQETAGSIHSFISGNGAAAINYLLGNNYQITDLITHHSLAVASFAGILARQIKWSEDDTKGVMLAGLLHDVGKLTAEKTDGITSRALIANTAALLKQTPGLSREVILGIIQHREYNDGSGLPTGANSAAIHPYAKLIAVCDTFHDQMFAKEQADPFLALNTLVYDMFGKLDPTMCQAFIRRVRDSLLCSKIILSDGEEAEIIYFPPNDSFLPVIKTTDNRIIDLSKEKHKKIHRVVSPGSSPMSAIMPSVG